jgi:hypothetical protein
MHAWTLLLLTIIPYEPVVTDRVCQLQIETYYDDNALPVFTQFLFKSQQPDGMYRIRDWKLKKAEPYISEGAMLFHDGDVMRRVSFDVLTEAHSQTDSELIERSEWPKEWRKPLRDARYEWMHRRGE